MNDHSTNQFEARQMLNKLWIESFNRDLGFLALALGRDSADLKALMVGRDSIDDDLVIRMRGMAGIRNIEIEFGMENAELSQDTIELNEFVSQFEKIKKNE